MNLTFCSLRRGTLGKCKIYKLHLYKIVSCFFYAATAICRPSEQAVGRAEFVAASRRCLAIIGVCSPILFVSQTSPIRFNFKLKRGRVFDCMSGSSKEGRKGSALSASRKGMNCGILSGLSGTMKGVSHDN